MRKWPRRIMLAGFISAGLAVGVGLLLVSLARAVPSFYRPIIALSPQERQAAAQRVENKLTEVQNHTARRRAEERAAERATVRIDSAPASDTPSPASTAHGDNRFEPEAIAVSFTADEINAFFDKWAAFQDWKKAYERYLTEPTVVLQDGRLILAGKVSDLGIVTSLCFEPKIDSNGRLQMPLVRVMGGRLPLPESIFDRYHQRFTRHLRVNLGAWQRSAAIDRRGAANPSAIAATSAQQLIGILGHEPVEPVLFLPMFGESGSVPVRITDVQIGDGSLSLRITPLSSTERAAMLARIRGQAGSNASLRSDAGEWGSPGRDRAAAGALADGTRN